MHDTFSQVAAHSITILGFGREGWSSYRFLRAHFPDKKIAIFDAKPRADLPLEYLERLDQDQYTQYHHFTKGAPHQKLEGTIIKSPGISPHSEWYTQLVSPAAHITSNLQLFFELVKRVAKHSDTPKLPEEIVVIGVTGTKGKSTTTSLIYQVLKAGGVNAYIGGNIGVPALDLLINLTGERAVVVLELSSHQLADVQLSPDIAVLQHISPEHLDYYNSFAEYLQAKSRITAFQKPGDSLLFNLDSPTARQVAEKSPAQKRGFSGEKTADGVFPVVAYSTNSGFFYENQWVMDTHKMRLKGSHNPLNALPSVIVGKMWGIEDDVIKKTITEFSALPHRLEEVAVVDGITFINDSLSTTPESTRAAVEAMAGRPVVLLAGGHDRHLEKQQYHDLAKYLADKVTALILFPETGALIRSCMEERTSSVPIYEVSSMPEAVTAAMTVAKPGDVVLLSPAAASFNLFKDYQDRGDQFKTEVKKRLPVEA